MQNQSILWLCYANVIQIKSSSFDCDSGKKNYIDIVTQPAGMLPARMLPARMLPARMLGVPQL
jgi:hypothetical protein